MKKLVLSITLIVVYFFSFAQESQTASSPLSTLPSEKSIGLGIDYLNHHTIELMYKCKKENNAFRLGIELSGTTNDKSISSITKNADSSLSIIHQYEYKNCLSVNGGLERYIHPQKTVSFYYGGGIIAGLGYDGTEDYKSNYTSTNLTTIYDKKNEEHLKRNGHKNFDYSFQGGLQALAGVNFKISKHFNLATEFKGKIIYVQGLGNIKNESHLNLIENLNFSLFYVFGKK